MPVSPDYAEGLAKALLEVYSDAEEQLLATIARRLATGGDAPRWAEQQLLTIQNLRAQTRVMIAQLQVNADAELTDAILTAYNRGVALAGVDLAAIGTPAALAFGGVDPGAVMTLVDTAKVSLGAMTLPIQSAAEAVFASVVHETAGRMLSGAVTRREASAGAILKWADRGITGFKDRAGRNWSMGAYAEMIARTASSQAVVAGHIDRLVDNGHDLAIVSDAPEECEKCRPWEGRIVSLSGDTRPGEYTAPNGTRYTVKGSLADAKADGLFHPNCRHRTGIYVPGLTQPLVDTEDPKGDQLRQEQRKRERDIRRLKTRARVLEEIHGPNSGQAKAARAATRTRSAEFKEWRTANGRKDLAYRTNINPPRAKGPEVLRRRPDPTPAPTRLDGPGSILTPEDRIRNAEAVFGVGSDEALAAARRFRPQKTGKGRTPRKLPDDVLDYNSREIRLASDADLDDALTRGYETDHPGTDRVVAEIDRREDEPRRLAEDKARRAEAAKAKRAAATEAKWDQVNQRIEAGEDPHSVIEEIIGTPIETQLRAEAFGRLKHSGARGNTLDEMIRNEYNDEVYRNWNAAEDDTRGHLLNHAAEMHNARWAGFRNKQIDPLKLFTGPEARARKWASDELLQWWDANGRPTLEDYRHQVIHGSVRSRDKGQDFLQ